jgi:hypothetical protein
MTFREGFATLCARVIGLVLLTASLLVFLPVPKTLAEGGGEIVGWGAQVILSEAELQDLVAVAGGSVHSLGLKTDGSIVAWGDNNYGQCIGMLPMTLPHSYTAD